MSFFDPTLTPDGKPYGLIRYKQIVKERYLITKHCNTSYVDLGKITPLERDYLLQFITEDKRKEHEAIENRRMKMKQKRK